jgi:putative DNA primase/helicase
VSVDTDRGVQRRAAALAQPNAQERSNGAVKFACPACLAEGFDYAKDNAVYFPDTDRWSCAWAHDTALSRAHWDAIGAALGVFQHQTGAGASAGRTLSSSGDNGSTPTGHAEPSRTRAAIVVRADTVTPESMTWLDPGRLAVGALTMGVGLPDQGKTLIACDLMARMTAGMLLAPAPRRPCLVEPRRVLMLTNEDTLATTIVPRLIKAGADLSRVTFIQMVRDADGAVSLLTLQDDLDALEAAIEHERPELVAIDGLVGYLGADVKSHNDADVRRVLSPFAALLARTRAAGLGLMHPPKVTTNLHYYAGGSVAFTAIPRVVLGIAPDPEDESDTPRRFLAKLKGNLYGRVPTLAYRIVAEHEAAVPVIEWEPEPVAINIADIFDPPKEQTEDRGQRHRCEGWLEDYLADGPHHSREVEAAAEAAGFSKPTLRRARETVCDSVKGGAPRQGKQQWDWVLRPKRATR